MAQSLETLRGLNVTPLFGRRIGLQRDDTLAGFPDVKLPIEDLTTSTGVTLLANGITAVITSGSTQGPVQYNLPAPIPGTRKIITMNTTSTGSHQFLSTANGASIRAASDGSTQRVINMLGGGMAILHAVSTAVWIAQHGYGSSGSPNVSYTTST